MNFKELPNIIISYLLFTGQKIIILKPIVVGISIILFVGIVILFFKSRAYLQESWLMTFKGIDVPVLPPDKIRQKWADIEKRLQTPDESNYKLAVIEADKLFDNLLERAGYAGQSMAERLKQIKPSQFSNIESLWHAHKLRNTIVHDIERRVTHQQARQALEAYKKALDELEVI